MDKDFLSVISFLKETKGYSDMVNKTLDLILDNKMNPIDRHSLFLSKGMNGVDDIKNDAINVIIDYATICLEDGTLTDAELKNITMLKLYFHIKDRDFKKMGKMLEVEKIITMQLSQLYEDNIIDYKEEIMMSGLQDIFGLSYDDFEAIVNKVAVKALDRGADIHKLNTSFMSWKE